MDGHGAKAEEHLGRLSELHEAIESAKAHK
jgi:hypothetical protein